MEAATVMLQVELQVKLGRLFLDVAFGGGDTPVALVGPNGSGKTTLLRTLVGAHRPVDGHLVLGGRRLFDRRLQIDLPPEQRSIGYVPQGRSLFPHLGVLDNVAFGLRGRASRRSAREAAARLLEEMGCGHLTDRPTAGLSGGEAQRIALARALMVEPQLLLLDEPLSALDSGARRELRAFLAEHLSSRRLPAVVVTHDPRDIRALDAHVVVLEGGTIVQTGSFDEVARHPSTEFVSELVDGYGWPSGR